MSKGNKMYRFAVFVLVMVAVLGVASGASDTVKPVIRNVSLSNTTPVAGDTIIVSVNATDNGNITYVIANSIVLSKQSGSIWVGVLTVSEGYHSVNVSVRDDGNNTAWNNGTSYWASAKKPAQTPVTVATTAKTEQTKSANASPTKSNSTPGFEGIATVITLIALLIVRRTQ